MLSESDWLKILQAIVVCAFTIVQVWYGRLIKNASVDANENIKKMQVEMQKEMQKCQE